MKKFLLKFSVCLVIFFLTIFVSGKIYNKGNEEKTTTTDVKVPTQDELWGSFKTAADITAFNATIVPAGEDQMPMIQQWVLFPMQHGKLMISERQVLPMSNRHSSNTQY